MPRRNTQDDEDRRTTSGAAAYWPTSYCSARSAPEAVPDRTVTVVVRPATKRTSGGTLSIATRTGTRPIGDVPADVLAAAECIGRVGFADRKLYKTEALLAAQPFGTVPAAFSPDGRSGIFESNSIMRTVARLGQERFAIDGRDAYESSRIDSFLDASLILPMMRRFICWRREMTAFRASCTRA